MDPKPSLTTLTENTTAGNLLLTADNGVTLRDNQAGRESQYKKIYKLSWAGAQTAYHLTPLALLGDPPDRKTGIHALEGVDLFNLLCIPRVAGS